MNKFIILLLLVFGFVALSSASRFRHGHRHRHGGYGHGGYEGHHGLDDYLDQDLEQDVDVDVNVHQGSGQRHGRGGFSRGRGLTGIGEHDLIGHRLHRRPHFHRGGLGKSNFRHHRHDGLGSHEFGSEFGHGLGHRFGGRGRRNFGRRHGIGGIGGLGLRDREGSLSSVNDHEHLGSGTFNREHDNEFLANNNNFGENHLDNRFNEQDGIRKHQVINRDKVFAKDTTTGVNDVDGFRNVDSGSSLGGSHGSSNQILGESSGSESGNKIELDRDFGAANAQTSDLEAGGVGAI